MIADASIDITLEWLQKNATKAAQARANRIYLEEYRKSLKAMIMTEKLEENPKLAVSAQEREAYADERYTDHLLTMKTAIAVDEQFRWEYVAAEARIEAWRTYQANNRIQARI